MLSHTPILYRQSLLSLSLSLSPSPSLPSPLSSLSSLSLTSTHTYLYEFTSAWYRSLEVLRSRIEELETVESDLLHSEAQVKELERKLRTFQHNEHFLQSQQQKVLKYDELERQLQHLTEENATLKGQQDNADLLRYKVQTLQERCARYEGLEAKLAQLELENQHLKETVKEEGSGEMAMMMMAEDREGGDSGSVMLGAKVGGGGRSQAALWYRIAELQQKEVLLTAKQGELTSRYRDSYVLTV